jgi:hypothetical protein
MNQSPKNAGMPVLRLALSISGGPLRYSRPMSFRQAIPSKLTAASAS